MIAKMWVYLFFIISIVHYGIILWGSTCKLYLDKSFKLQKWAIRVISNNHYRSHKGPLFLKHILNVHDAYKLSIGIFMYKHHTNQLPSNFSSYFTKHIQTHNYLTRNTQDYIINKTKVFLDRAKRNCGPVFWNSLDKKHKIMQKYYNIQR